MLSAGDRQRISIVGFNGNGVDEVDRLSAELVETEKDIKSLAAALVQLDDYCRRQERFFGKQLEDLRAEFDELTRKPRALGRKS